MKKTLLPEDIIYELEHPGREHGYYIKRRIFGKASVQSLRHAISIAKSGLTKGNICEILGWRKARSAIPELITCLRDRSPYTRQEAVDALGRIGSSEIGSILLAHFTSYERNADVLSTYAYSLGWLAYRPAIPALRKALFHQEGLVRVCAAEALSRLQDIESLPELAQALAEEPEASSHHKRLQDSLVALQKVLHHENT